MGLPKTELAVSDEELDLIMTELEIPEPKALAEKEASFKSASGLSYYVDVDKFNADYSVSEANLDACMMEQSSTRAFYGAQAAYAEGQASRTKLRFDVIEAGLYEEKRTDMTSSGEKVTEKMVEAAVKADKRWLNAKNAVIEAETIAAVNKSLVVALSDRKDMLVQLGADRREGLKGQLRIMGGAAAEVDKTSMMDALDKFRAN